MGGLDPRRSIAENYRVFGREARGRSAVYESLAAAVADDDLVLGFLATLPPPKRQPNLLFAAGPKIELLTPTGGPDAAFLERFLAAHGAGPHHFNFIVSDIEQTLARLRALGLEPTGVNLDHPNWKEAFLHPRSAHGIVVQVAQQAGEPRTPAPRELPEPGPRSWPGPAAGGSGWCARTACRWAGRCITSGSPAPRVRSAPRTASARACWPSAWAWPWNWPASQRLLRGGRGSSGAGRAG